ncbi:thioredoxin O2, mitochondrial-like [Iris pallida]|uniref:Thioredoxin O2, mitochondrial-like n=1 Tax=Iris pallida TaxID=29817 RepID=A0AAX6DM51_IRIPA|nr:thioredoxin O2, mitochondrial-like [Iris pallida]
MARRVLRPLLLQSSISLSSRTHHHRHFSSSSSSSPSSKAPSPPPFSSPRTHSSYFSSRPFSSSSSSSSNVVHIGSDDGFTKVVSKVHDEKLSAIFYFTAAWCGPCKMLSPVLEEMIKKFPHVTLYKIDIDQESIASTLSNLKIYSVPTLHLFHDGKKATEVVGADITRLKDAMENLYKKE